MKLIKELKNKPLCAINNEVKKKNENNDENSKTRWNKTAAA